MSAGPTAAQMLTSLSDSLQGLLLLVTALSYVSGMIMMIRGLMKFKSFGQHANMMGGRGELTEPMILIVIGAVLLYLPSVLNVSFYTFFQSAGTSSIALTGEEASQLITYANTQGEGSSAQLMEVLLGYTKLIGLIAFVRGWHLISHIGSSNTQPGSVTKGLVHLVGGIAAMNALEMINVLARSIGYTNGIF